MKPYIISINGLDGSGKETTSKALIEAIEKDPQVKMDLEYVSFPDYTSKTGERIKKVLSGDYSLIKYGDNPFTRPYEVARLFADNRKEYFKNHPLKDNTIYVFDRYVESNILYQGLGKSGDELFWFNEALRDMDEGNPIPNISIILRVPYIELRRRLDLRKSIKAGIDHDKYEDDSFLKGVYHLSEYILLLPKGQINPYDLVINVGSGNLCQPVEFIVNQIIDTLKNRNEYIQFHYRS